MEFLPDPTAKLGASDELEVLIFSGNGSFKMYDDDGITTGYKNGMFAKTDFTLETKGDSVDFSISVSGDLSFVPERKYILSFRNIADSENIEVFVCKSRVEGYLSSLSSHRHRRIQSCPKTEKETKRCRSASLRRKNSTYKTAQSGKAFQ